VVKKLILIWIFSLLLVLGNKNEIYAASNWNVSKPDFTIDVMSISPWWNSLIWATWKDTFKIILEQIIYNLMVAIWVIATLIMTIWWWYMILNWWEDALLTKWKAIFKAGAIALVIALSSWIIIKLIIYLLY